jgi:hypothetical protein
MKPELEASLKALKKAGWQVEMRPAELAEVSLPEAVRERFGRLPEDYLEFLATVSKCENPDAVAWFLTADDFCGGADARFRWDEIEQMFVPGPEDADNLAAWQAFWREHLLTFISGSMDYAYLALRLGQHERGSVVEGYSPVFEDTEKVCDSFTDLCVMLTQYYEDGIQSDFLAAIL